MAEERSYPQITNESIQAWGETIGVSDLSTETLRSISADATYRLQQVLSNCTKLLSHSKRKKLNSDDFNRVLKWMDCPPVYGYSGSESTEWVSLPELGVFTPHDAPVNLASTALSGDIYHQPGSCYVKAKWAHVNGHLIVKSESNSEEKMLSTLPLSPDLTQYYRTLFSAVTSPSNTLFQTMCEDVGKSANIGPLVGPIIRSVLKGAQKARQKPLILRRLLLIIRALLFNPNIHLGPHNYIHDIVNVLVFSVVTERKNPQDTQAIRTLAANILLKLSRSEGEVGTAWELAVMSLSGVVGSSTRSWTQHAGALTGLSFLGFHALDRALAPIAPAYYRRLSPILANPPAVSVSSQVSAKDTLDAHMTAGLLLGGFVHMMVEFMKRLPDNNFIRLSSEESSSNISHLVHKLHHLYFLGAEMFGSAFVLQIPSVFLTYETFISDKFKLVRPYSPPQEWGEQSFSSSSPPTKKKIKKPQQPIKPSSFWFYPTGKFIPQKSKLSPNQVFENYTPDFVPANQRRIYMCIRGCSARSFEFLEQKKSTLPSFVSSSAYQNYVLFSANQKRALGRLNFWKYYSVTAPRTAPVRKNYSHALMFHI